MDMGKGKRPKKGSLGTREGERGREMSKCLFSPRKKRQNEEKDILCREEENERKTSNGRNVVVRSDILRVQRSINDAGLL